MRWRALFDDLGAQLDAERDAERDGRGIEVERQRTARTRLLDRVAALRADSNGVQLRLADGTDLALTGIEVGADWVAGVDRGLHRGSGAPGCLVPSSAIAAVLLPHRPELTSRAAPVPEAPPAAARSHGSGVSHDVGDSHDAGGGHDAGRGHEAGTRSGGHPASTAPIPLTMVLRDLARQRIPVTVFVTSARAHGTIDRVGADHLELACHEPGEARRAAAVRWIELVPLAQLLLVRFRW